VKAGVLNFPKYPVSNLDSNPTPNRYS